MDIRFIEPYKDMYNYYNLITKINSNYTLCFDKKHKCFLVVNFANNNEICLKFSNFSQNIPQILQKTQISNSKKLFDFIDKNNEILKEKNAKNITNKIKDKTLEIDWLIKRKSKVLPNDIKKIIEV